LYDHLRRYEQYLILPRALPEANPAWFGFLMTVRDGASFTKSDIVSFLEGKKIATRMLFAGNITKQPYFEGRHYHVAGNLMNTDFVMTNTFWIGVYPGLTKEMLGYMADTFDEFFAHLQAHT
jgi:CDP-6-deoxy-D-xylo-4-hexulose-3-dehydrase